MSSNQNNASAAIPVYVAQTQSNLLTQTILTTSGTNQTLIHSGIANLWNLTGSNPTSGNVYVHIFDKSTTPVAGTDSAKFTIPVLASSSICNNYQTSIPFINGIGLTVTSGASLIDSGSVASNSFIGFVTFT